MTGESSNQGVPPDVVYIHRPSGQDSSVLRYSLRTLTNLPHGRVWIAGYKPAWCANVRHIPVVQADTKHVNQQRNIWAAVNHPEVADDFVYFNDDFFILNPLDGMPTHHRGAVPAKLLEKHTRQQGAYRQGLSDTVRLLAEWGYDNLLSYELHIPLPVHKPAMREALGRAGVGRIPALQFRTLYGNYDRIGGTRLPDVKVKNTSHTWEDDQVFLSTSDAAFLNGVSGRRLRKLLTEPSPYER